jgi:hypothetical protein
MAGGGAPATAVEGGATWMCPNGHVVETGLAKCPYCPSSARGGAPATMPESGGRKAPPAIKPTMPPRDEVEEGRKSSPGRGARRDATVVYDEEDKPLAGWLVVIAGREESPYKDFRIVEGKNAIGRQGGSCQVGIRDDGASKEHAILVVKAGQYRITDLGSSNGTIVNDEKIDTAVLNDGDRIKIGKTVLMLRTFTHRVE